MKEPRESPRATPLEMLERLLDIPAVGVRPALDQVAQVLAEALGADKVDTFLHDPARNSLVALGTSHTPMGRKQQALGLDVLPIANGGTVVETFQTGRVYHSGRLDQDPREVRGLVESLGIRSQVNVPLEIGGARRGVVSISSAEPERFSEQDVRFAEVATRWVAMVAHRAQLAEEVAAKAAEQARRTAAEELVTMLAHDLRNHLSPLRARLDLIRRRAQRDGRASDVRDADLAQRSMDRVQGMVSDLLDVSRIERGIFALETHPFDLCELVREVASTLTAGAVRVDARTPGEVVVAGDPQRLRQALENVIGNAIKHSPPGAPVLVEVSIDPRDGRPCAVVDVVDRGPGVAREVLPRLFERFVRGGQSAGLGLGLFLARQIALAHGGNLSVEATHSPGSRFRFELPLEEVVEATASPRAASAEQGDRTPGGSLRE